MPNANRLFILIDLRTQAGLSQAAAAALCGLTGRQGRKSLSGWELGEAVPKANRRRRFIGYLWDSLHLRERPQEFETVWGVLVEEWGWDPISDAEWRDFTSTQRPPRAAATAQPRPLQRPLRVQHFTGRSEELTKLLADLQPGRQVTLCGPGGIGKTALAAEAVWRLAPGDDPPERFPDGVIFHSFYHQAEADAALESIARAYGVEPRPTPRDAARMALANRKTLLILDGAEAADDLLAVLAVAGTCGVLITSRQHSDAPAEFQDLPPLPDPESLELLRAWAGRYADDETAAKEIVQLLGGLPLAIFLAGRYMAQRSQKAQDYAAWLCAQGPPALHESNRPSRSIPLLLARSLEQVSADARAVFSVTGELALAPFDVEPIAAALQLNRITAHYALGELVNYGLLLRPDDSYLVTHALAHGYARTEAVPEAKTTGRLARYYMGLAEGKIRRGTVGFAVLAPQRAHIVAVQAAALKTDQWDVVREITWKVEDFLALQGYFIDCRAVILAGLAAARASGARHDEAEFMTRLGIAWFTSGEIHHAIEQYKQTLVLAREICDRRIEGGVLVNLGLAYAALGETRRSVDLYEKALVIMREIGDRRGEGAALGSLGAAYADLGETRRAIEFHEQALVISREIGDHRGESSDLGNLGIVYNDLGETRRAIELYEQALTMLRKIGNRRGEGAILGNIGAAYAALGDIRRSIKYYEQALAVDREIGDRRGEAADLGNLGIAFKNLGVTRRAIELYEQQLVITRQISDRRAEGNALGNLGQLYIAMGEIPRAVACYEQRLVIAREIEDRKGEGTALSNLGIAYKKLGETRRAIELYEQALVILREIEYRRGEGSTLGNLGAAYAVLGENRRAIELHEQALVILREIRDRRAETLVSWNLGEIYEKEGDLTRAVSNMQVCVDYEQEIGHPDAAADAQRLADLKQRAGL